MGENEDIHWRRGHWQSGATEKMGGGVTSLLVESYQERHTKQINFKLRKAERVQVIS